MSKYFDLFPKIRYDIAGNQFTNYQNVTNIFFRLGVLQEILGNISAYYEHIISDGDTPEILAEKVYGDPEAHWIILIANNIVDAQYDWPLDGRTFNNYIIGKYGSTANAQITIHHYEKVITREESTTGLVTETRFIVNQEKLTDNDLDVPYDYYEGDGSLPETQSVETFNLSSGETVVQVIRREAISNYDYEDALNESKRTIKVIKPEYYTQIMSEFTRLTENSASPFFRRLF
jgi:predicted DNA-binding protein YlxM (UPF0122 family)